MDMQTLNIQQIYKINSKALIKPVTVQKNKQLSLPNELQSNSSLRLNNKQLR